MPEEIELLKQAASEIKSLRRKNELMEARLDMFDTINMMLHSQPATRSVGMSEDLVWTIEKFILSKDAPDKSS